MISPQFALVGMLMLGALAVGAVVWLVAASRDRGRERLATLSTADVGPTETAGRGPAVRQDPVPVLTRALEGTKLWQDLQLQLIRGGWILRPSEFIAMSVGAGVGGFLIGSVMLKGSPMAALLGLAAAAAPHMALKSRQQARLRSLTSQLPDTLDMLGNSLRSGFAVLRAFQVVRAQMHPPIAEELGRVVDEVQFGTTIGDALDNLVLRTGSYDLELIVAAVQTQLTVGGNLAEVFDSIAQVIRERVRMQGELAAATAEGRISAYILLAMPFVMALAVNILSPGYIAPLFQETLGQMLVGAALGLMALGALVIRKLIDIDL